MSDIVSLDEMFGRKTGGDVIPLGQFSGGAITSGPPASWETLPKRQTFLKSIEQGIGDPYVGALQLGARALPGIPSEASAAIDRAVTERGANIAASRPDQFDINSKQLPGDPGASHLPVNRGPGVDFGRAIGNVIGTIPLLPVGGPIVGGMTTAATMPVEGGGNFWLEKLKQVGMGGAAADHRLEKSFPTERSSRVPTTPR